MKAGPATVRQLLEYRQRFCVPIYQRHYVWSGDKQWEPCWHSAYAQGVHEIGLAPDPAQARSLFERALDGGGEELYRYADAGGRGWIVTAHQVRRWLERLPE